VITFNEIPFTNTYQMGNWITAFLPGYFLATNSGTDGSIRSVIMSRFPMNRAQKWLDGADLKPFGYTNTNSAAADNFTRDLFEAEIAVPNWPLPLHVFTTHLKSTSGTTYADAAAKRAAEAAAITNFFATNFFTLYPTHPFTLSGDMNDSDTNTVAIQRLISAPTTLRLTNPTNFFSGTINTFSIQASVSERIDFIFPCPLLHSNITASQVFRTDLLTNFSSNLFSNDDKIASDHLPVLMTFANPFNTPFKLVSITRTDQAVTLRWESQNNRTFSVEASSNLVSWTPFAANLFTATTNSPLVYSTNNVPEPVNFFRVYRVP
jgi:endonuclease/exonuclease/phosphatase family metal-dependent hydrolase